MMFVEASRLKLDAFGGVSVASSKVALAKTLFRDGGNIGFFVLVLI
jgi:hypothetical protein